MTDSTEDSTEERGMLVWIYRQADGSDSTGGGVTSRVTRAVLVGEGIPALFAPFPDRPLLRLVRRNIRGLGPYLHCVPDPAFEPRASSGKHVGPMFGGNYVAANDSRMPSPYPIPVHDRYETTEDYNDND
jgi:hypothetical protein